MQWSCVFAHWKYVEQLVETTHIQFLVIFLQQIKHSETSETRNHYSTWSEKDKASTIVNEVANCSPRTIQKYSLPSGDWGFDTRSELEKKRRQKERNPVRLRRHQNQPKNRKRMTQNKKKENQTSPKQSSKIQRTSSKQSSKIRCTHCTSSSNSRLDWDFRTSLTLWIILHCIQITVHTCLKISIDITKF